MDRQGGAVTPDTLQRARPGESLRIVAIGGGHGLSTMLRGLKHYAKDITAIVTVADNGGGSGVLRQDLGMLPPGDARDCISALANTEPELLRLMNYRFSDGSLAGQSMGNLFLAALNGIYGSFSDAVRHMGQILAITGRVLPVTEEDVHLQAQFSDGSTVLGESEIFYRKKETMDRIQRVTLLPEHPEAFPDCITAIEQADLILIGPGSLYTSIIPNFLVQGITEAVQRSRATRIFVLNLMTQDGETEEYTASDHLRALLRHTGPGIVDCCLANSGPVPEHLKAEYLREGAEPLTVDREALEAMGTDLYLAPMLSAGSEYARHDPDLLAQAILNVYLERQRAGIQ